MIIGKINNFNPDHDFGFLKSNDKEKVFFHGSAVENKKPAELEIGQQVKYQIAQGKQGPQAVKIRVID
jgi:cold shock protein